MRAWQLHPVGTPSHDLASCGHTASRACRNEFYSCPWRLEEVGRPDEGWPVFNLWDPSHISTYERCQWRWAHRASTCTGIFLEMPAAASVLPASFRERGCRDCSSGQAALLGQLCLVIVAGRPVMESGDGVLRVLPAWQGQCDMGRSGLPATVLQIRDQFRVRSLVQVRPFLSVLYSCLG